MDQRNIIWSVLDGEAILLDTVSGHYFSLNPLGTEIWNCLQRGESASQIIADIARKYGVENAAVEQDVNELLSELRLARLWN